MGCIIVYNSSCKPICVFVSTYTRSGGDESWFTLAPGARESWRRNKGWELVAFKDEKDTQRVGVYARVDDLVTFTGDFEDVTIA